MPSRYSSNNYFNAGLKTCSGQDSSALSQSFRFACDFGALQIRPPDIVCRRTYILPVFLSSFFFLFFRRLISEVAERNSTIIGHMVGSKCNLKTHIRNLGYPLPLQIGGPKTTFFGRLRNLMATLTAYIFGMKHDIDNLSSALTTTRCLLHCPKMS